MPVIEIDHLSKRYGRHTAVADVSFAVEQGEIFGVLGPNGAGKTTTVECMVGLRRRDAGDVCVLGADPATDRDVLRRQVGVQLQEAALPDRMTVAEALRLFASFYEQPADIEDLVATLGLGPVLDRRFAKLSGGQQQRLSIALALIGTPRIAVLDELTTGLDPNARRETWELIRRVRDRGVTVVLVTHFMPEAEYLCDRLAVIDSGRVVALDSPAGIVATSAGSATQWMRFLPSRPVDRARLLALPDVATVETNGETLTVTGNGDVVSAVTALLAHDGVIAHQLRVEQRSLDDAFADLTKLTMEETA